LLGRNLARTEGNYAAEYRLRRGRSAGRRRRLRRNANLARAGLILARMLMQRKRHCRPDCQQQREPRDSPRDRLHGSLES